MTRAPPPALGTTTPPTEGFPRELLLENERPVIELKPTKLPFILLPLAGSVMLLFIGAFVLSTTAVSRGVAFALYVCGLLSIPLLAILAVSVVVSYFRWRGTFYAVTDRRIVASSGSLGQTLVECPLDKVQNVSMTQTWFQKSMGYGAISFATSGVGQGIANLQQGFRPWALGTGAPALFGSIVFFGVREPMVLMKKIEALVEAAVAAKKDADYRHMARAFKEEGTAIATPAPTGSPRAAQAQVTQQPEVIVVRPRGAPKFCEFCGTPAVGSPKYCERCGARLE